MKVLMLDIDGVLNSVSSFIYHNRLFLSGKTTIPTHKSVCSIAFSNLRYILEEIPDIKIVITSTWRKYETLDELRKRFESNGVPPETLVGVTPTSEDGYRGKEIALYLGDHLEVSDFVILDDDSDLEPFLDRLVKVDGRNGLTFTDAERVIEKFGGPNEKE